MLNNAYALKRNLLHKFKLYTVRIKAARLFCVSWLSTYDMTFRHDLNFNPY